MSKLPLSALMFLVAMAVAPNSVAQDDVTDELKQRLIKWQKHSNNHDADSLAGLYLKDCDVVHMDAPSKDRQGMHDAWTEHFNRNPKVQITIDLSQVTYRIIDPTTAIESGTWQESGHSQVGLPTQGSYTCVQRKIDGNWQIVHERAWSDPAAPLSTGRDFGSDRTIPDTVHEQLSRIVGDWTFETTLNGKTTTSTITVEWAKGDHCVKYNGKGTDAVTGESYFANGLVGYDAVSEKTIERGFSSDGESMHSSIDFSAPDRWISPVEKAARTKDGKFVTEKMQREFIWDGDDEVVIRRTQRLVDGQPAPDMDTVCRRRSTKMPPELATVLDTLVGKWDCERTFGDQTEQVLFEAKWQPGRSAIVYQSKATDSGGISDCIVGWDPDSQSLTEHGFTSGGARWVIHWSNLADGKWTGTGTSSQDGKQYHSACQLTFADGKSEFHGQWLGQPMHIQRTRID